MLAIVAAVLFGIGLIIELVGASLPFISSTALLLAGLLCLALQLAGVGTRTRAARR